MSTIRANSITNSAGTGAPDFPNGLTDNGVAVATTADLSTINTALEFISSATINNVATVDFTGFNSSKYSDYVFSLNNVVPVNDNVFMSLLFSVNGGSSFEYLYDYCGYAAVPATGSYTLSPDGAVGNNLIRLASSVGSDTNEFGISGQVIVFGPDLAARTRASYNISLADTGGFLEQSSGVAQNRTTSAVNAVRFSFSSGNLESGRITMYGVRKS